MFMKLKSIIILLLLLLGAYIPLNMVVEPYLIETKEVVIESPEIPADFDGKKIAFISDIHHSPFFDKDRVNSLVNQVNDLNPDLILLGGDYVSGDSEYIAPVFSSLSHLKAPMGVYAVLGNSDPQYWTLDTLSKSNITYIGNKGTWITLGNSKIRLGGVGDFNNGNQIINATIKPVAKEDFVILISHNPDYFPEVDKTKVDLVLSGHTHGGQITFFGLWAPVVYSNYGNKYRNGVIKENNSTMIVSNGIGTVVIPVRFFARPQIYLIELKRSN